MVASNHTGTKPKSKAARAVDYMRETGCTAYAAAKHLDVATSAVYAMVERQRAMVGHPCPCCGQIVQAEQ